MAPTSEIKRKAQHSLSREIDRIADRYTRETLSDLICHPAVWINDPSYQTSLAIRRRLRKALYQQRQARATKHYTFNLSRYKALLAALIAERRMARPLVRKAA